MRAGTTVTREPVEIDSDRLRSAIKKHGTTLAEFSEGLGYDSSYVGKILRRGSVNAYTLDAIANRLGEHPCMFERG